MTWTLLARVPIWAAALIGVVLGVILAWVAHRTTGDSALVLHDPPDTITAAALQRRALDFENPWEPKPEQPRLAVRPLRPMPEPGTEEGQGEGGKAVQP